MPVELLSPMALPCGAVIAHRLAKPAITEGLADPAGWPTDRLERLYGDWADAGFALMISGNIIVDGDHIERPGNIIIEREPTPEQRQKLTSWTAMARRGGAHFWAQLSHSGRQTQKSVNPHPLSPSAIAVGLPGGLFGKPREISEAEILDVIERFGTAAAVCSQWVSRAFRSTRQRLPDFVVSQPRCQPADGPVGRQPRKPGTAADVDRRQGA